MRSSTVASRYRRDRAGLGAIQNVYQAAISATVRRPLSYIRALLYTLSPSRNMGPSRLLRFLFIFLALAAPFTISSAQIAPVLDPPAELIPDGQPTPDNVLFLPLSGSVTKKRIDGLLVPSRLWSRQQEVTCATNYSVCQGSQFCCPNGNVCCSGEFLPLLGRTLSRRGCGCQLLTPFTQHRHVLGGNCCGAGYDSRL